MDIALHMVYMEYIWDKCIYMDIWIYGCMVEPLGNWETGIMSTPDFAKPWFMKIKGVLLQ